MQERRKHLRWCSLFRLTIRIDCCAIWLFFSQVMPLTSGPISKNDFSRSSNSSFDVSWEGDYDAGKMNVVPLESKVIIDFFSLAKTAI